MDKPMEAVVQDLELRTLAGLPGNIGRLVYLSSTRDFNTGRYCHAGLAVRFGPEAAEAALNQSHKQVFQSLLHMTLRQLVCALEEYLEAAGESGGRVLEAWRKLRAYQVLVPEGSDSISAEFLVANIKIALVILRNRTKPERVAPNAPQPQSLGQ